MISLAVKSLIFPELLFLQFPDEHIPNAYIIS